MKIRPERTEDANDVHHVNRQAFGQENEAILVETLLSSPEAIPELSLVAEQDGRVVGHILFSPIVIETSSGEVSALALAPVAVLPEFQNQGIGSRLVQDGLEACRQLGHKIVIVLGHANYYPRFGFSPARARGIEAPFPVPDEAWMAVELQAGALDGVRGKVKYPPAFDEV